MPVRPMQSPRRINCCAFTVRSNRATAVDQNVKVLPPVKALKGNSHFDVLEVWGHIYKADYRMRLIYAQIKGSCALMGQEILEASDPY
jgi:hypothetical protein